MHIDFYVFVYYMYENFLACQAPLTVEFSRQEYCSELPFPTPGDLPDPGIKPTSFTSTCIDRQVLYH